MFAYNTIKQSYIIGFFNSNGDSFNNLVIAVFLGYVKGKLGGISGLCKTKGRRSNCILILVDLALPLVGIFACESVSDKAVTDVAGVNDIRLVNVAIHNVGAFNLTFVIKFIMQAFNTVCQKVKKLSIGIDFFKDGHNMLEFIGINAAVNTEDVFNSRIVGSDRLGVTNVFVCIGTQLALDIVNIAGFNANSITGIFISFAVCICKVSKVVVLSD